MFESYVETVKKALKASEEKDIPLSQLVSNNSLFNPNGFREKLLNLDTLSDKELYELVKDNYKSILSDVFIKDNREYFNVFSNTRFITAMIQSLAVMDDLTYDERIYCNKLCYDYMTYNNSKDSYTKQLFLSLSRTVNKTIIPRLLNLGIDESTACYLALARYSSAKEFVNVKRMNFVIQSSSPNIMTEQTIVDIYCTLFEKITPLFEASMFDIYEKPDSEEEANEDMELIYSTISLALLDILEAMPSEEIRKVLISYTGDYQILHSDNPVRFSMDTVAVCDYPRLMNVIELLKAENIYVP